VAEAISPTPLASPPLEQIDQRTESRDVRTHQPADAGRSPTATPHRGGDGVRRRLEFLRGLRVSILSERRGPYAPFGLAGGAPGALGENTLQRAGSDTIETSAAKSNSPSPPATS